MLLLGSLLRFARWASRFCSRALVPLLVILVTPGVTELGQELVCAVMGIDTCEADDCDEGSGECCPRACVHCVCCAHVSVAPLAALRLPAVAEPREKPFSGQPLGAYAPGYRAPPFRPPLAA
jgi:hypothetical protein